MFPLLVQGFFAHQPVACWDHRRWGHVDHVRPELVKFSLARVYVLFIPGPLQSGPEG